MAREKGKSVEIHIVEKNKWNGRVTNVEIIDEFELLDVFAEAMESAGWFNRMMNNGTVESIAFKKLHKFMRNRLKENKNR